MSNHKPKREPGAWMGRFYNYDKMSLDEKVNFLSGELQTERLLVGEYRQQIAELRTLVAIQRRLLEARGITPPDSPAQEGARNEQRRIPRAVLRPERDTDNRDVRGALERSLERLS